MPGTSGTPCTDPSKDGTLFLRYGPIKGLTDTFWNATLIGQMPVKTTILTGVLRFLDGVLQGESKVKTPSARDQVATLDEAQSILKPLLTVPEG